MKVGDRVYHTVFLWTGTVIEISVMIRDGQPAAKVKWDAGNWLWVYQDRLLIKEKA